MSASGNIQSNAGVPVVAVPHRAQPPEGTQGGSEPQSVKAVEGAAKISHLTRDHQQSQQIRVDGTRLTVALDSDSGKFVYKSVEQPEGEVVWQWPREEVLRVLQYFRQVESAPAPEPPHQVDRSV